MHGWGSELSLGKGAARGEEKRAKCRCWHLSLARYLFFSLSLSSFFFPQNSPASRAVAAVKLAAAAPTAASAASAAATGAATPRGPVGELVAVLRSVIETATAAAAASSSAAATAAAACSAAGRRVSAQAVSDRVAWW